jgi:hypothetical protein
MDKAQLVCIVDDDASDAKPRGLNTATFASAEEYLLSQ